MVGGFHRSGRHTGQHQETTDLLSHGGDQLHLAAGVLVREAVLHVDHAHYAIAGNHRRREEGFEGVLGELPEGLEAGIGVGLPGDGQQAAARGPPIR